MLVVNAHVHVNQCSGAVHVTTIHGELRLCMTASPEHQSVQPHSSYRVALLPRVMTIDILDMFSAPYMYIQRLGVIQSAVACGVHFSCF